MVEYARLQVIDQHRFGFGSSLSLLDNMLPYSVDCRLDFISRSHAVYFESGRVNMPARSCNTPDIHVFGTGLNKARGGGYRRCFGCDHIVNDSD